MKGLRARAVQWFRDRGQSDGELSAASEPEVTTEPTPMWISKRTSTARILATLLLACLVVWYVPSVLSTLVGGFALALMLSFPVRWFSRVMARGLAILLTFLIVAGILVLLAVIIGGGLGGLVGVVVAVPSLAVLRVLFDFFRVRLKTEG